MHFIHSRKIFPSLEDKMLLRGYKDGYFSVKNMYRLLEQANSVCFPVRLLWSPLVPTKVGFLNGRLSRKRC